MRCFKKHTRLTKDDQICIPYRSTLALQGTNSVYKSNGDEDKMDT